MKSLSIFLEDLKNGATYMSNQSGLFLTKLFFQTEFNDRAKAALSLVNPVLLSMYT